MKDIWQGEELKKYLRETQRIKKPCGYITARLSYNYQEHQRKVKQRKFDRLINWTLTVVAILALIKLILIW